MAQTLFLRSNASGVFSGDLTLETVAGAADYTAFPTSIQRAKTLASWLYNPLVASNTTAISDPPSTTVLSVGWCFDAAAAGSYADADWTINLLFTDTVAAGSVTYEAQLWVLNAAGAIVSQIGGLVASAVVTPIIANTRQVLTITAPGIITLAANQYLYLEVYLKQTVSSGSNSATSALILDDPTSTLQGCIVTPNFTASGATDSFNRANASDLGTNWTVQSTYNAFALTSNEAVVNSAGTASEYNNTWTPTAAQYSKVILGSVIDTGPSGNTSAGSGPAVRMSTTAGTHYRVMCVSTGIALFKRAAATTQLGATYTHTCVTGDVVELRITAAHVLTVLLNGVSIITYDDSAGTPLTDNMVGMMGVAWNLFSTLNSWEGGDLAAALPAPYQRWGLEAGGGFAWALEAGVGYWITEASGPGGTTYTQSVGGGATPTGYLARKTGKTFGGGVTPAGAIVRSTRKAFGGGSTPSGALLRLMAKIFTGGATPAGALARRISKTVVGAMTPSGALATLKLIMRTLSGGVTPTGNLSRRVSKTVSGGATPSGTLAKLMSRIFGGGVTPTGSLSKARGQILGGGATPAGAVSRQPNKAIGGSSTPAGVVAKLINKILGGGATPIGTLVQAKVFLRSLAGGVTPSGSVARRANKVFGGNTTPAGTLSRVVAHLLTLVGGIFPSGTLTRQAAKTFGGGVTPGGVVSAAKVFLRTLTGGATPTGTLARRANKVLGGLATPAGVLTRLIRKILAGGITPTGTLLRGKFSTKVLAGGVTPTGTVSRQAQKNLGGGVTPSGALIRRIFKTIVGAVTPAGLLDLGKRLHLTLEGVVTPIGDLLAVFGNAFQFFFTVIRGGAKFGASLFYSGPKTSVKGDPTGGPKINADNTSQSKLNEKRRL